MALSDVWKLKDYILKSGKQWKAVVLETTLEALSILPGVSTAKALYQTYAGATEMSPKDAAKAPEKLIDMMQDAFEKNKIPAWLQTPLMLMVIVNIYKKTAEDVAATTAEKKILQPLRKELRPALLDVSSAISAQLRGLLKDEEVKEIAGRMGIKDEDLKILQQLAFYVPTAPDIVSFAVREAYDESVASKFGADDNLDAVLKASEKDRRSAGLSDDLIRKYWRAHWDLPSVGQGFEMLQRGFINSDELDMLLRAKDILPFWREKLTKISYNLLTRVDVRRMHKLKIISDTELVAAYQKMGHERSDAEKLAKFTIEYNKNPEAAERTASDDVKLKERDLTKAEIISSFNSKMIKEDKTKELLRGLGYSTEEVDLLVGRELYKQEQAKLGKVLTTYKNIYLKGIADKETISVQLAQIPLEKEQIDELFSDWDLEVISKLDLPTRADVIRWFKAKRIDEDQARNYLSMIGVQTEFADLYLAEVK